MIGFTKKRNKIVIYTAITWEKDKLLDPVVKVPNCDFVCFTTMPNLKSKIWEIRKVPKLYENQRQEAKIYKLLPHFFLQEYEYSFWIDGRVLIKSPNIVNFLLKSLEASNIALLRHPERTSIFEEAEKCIEWGLDDPDKINKQIKDYKEKGYDDQFPLVAGTVIARRHMQKDVIASMEAWWVENVTHTLRDQLSFPYIAWLNNLNVRVLDLNWQENEYFKILSYEERDALRESN